ncbi:hypothetical protein QTP86_034470, partial [Hemibagrus guttatus]
VAHGILQGNGNLQLSTLMALANESGVWTNATLCHILSNNLPDVEKVHELLAQEGPTLLDMRIKHLIKQKCVEKAAVLAKTCAEFPEFGGKKNFKQIYLVCLCETMSQQELMQEASIKEIDCKDALDMICNLESEENEKGALSLCTAFFKRQLLQGDVYCAWELTLFWSKLLIRLESAQAFLDQCRLLAQLSGSVYHILLLIKVIQAEVQNEGLPVCIEMCIQALKIGLSDNEDCNTTICKTISCLLPLDLEVKRACQLTEFLVKPTVDSYYAVETLFNEPDQKLEEESLPIPNSLRCDLLLALKTQWPFDPEFWDWKTLKRHCLALMGEEASIVSSIDKLNDSEENEGLLDADENDFKHLEFSLSPTSESSSIEAERKKKREMKKLREKGFVSARFRNWQAYMQYCVLCDKEFLGHRIVKHALKHVQDGIEVGKFQCDQSKCSAYFTCHLKYIDHIKNDHKAIRVSADGDFESVDLTFKCEYEGCDRVYTTKSNLLRHFMKKHQTTFEPIKQKQKKGDAETESAKTLAAKPNDGKENISSNKIKLKKKSLKKKEEKARNHWTSFGKPSLKSMDEASAMCTGQFLLQYPCMIKGCDSVSSTERNIVKHYTTHGLTERYIENQRSHFIFCKKNSRLRNKEGGKSDDISSDITELGKADAYENTDPIETADHQQQVDPLEAVDSIQNTDSSQKADPQQNADPTRKTDFQQNAEPTQNTDPQQNTEPQQKADPANSMVNSQDPEPENGAPPKTEQLAFANCTSELIPVKRKRGRPRKSEQTLKINPQRKQSLRHTTTDINFVPKVSESTSNPAAHHQEQTESGVAQKLFSPLGFKASILKLFEEPPPTNTFKRKSSESDWTDKPLKRKQKNLNANSIYKNAVFLKKSEDQNMVHFRNPLKLESVNNVKIVMDGSFSNGADLLLKQLQDMRPTVILKKWLCS